MKSSLKIGKISKIFITHLHGDHVFGLPGLMCTVSQNNQRSEPVEVYGPRGLRNYLRVSLGHSHAELGFSFVVHELELVPEQLPPEKWPIDDSPDAAVHPNEVPGSVIRCDEQQVWTCVSDNSCMVRAVWVQHRVPCFAFVVQEHDRPGRLDVEKLKSLGVPPGPVYGRIKAGETVTLPSGVKVSPEDVLGESLKGLVVAVGGDSSDSSQLLKVAQNADLLVHEATSENANHELCIERGHSTPKMTAELAKMLGVKRLIITHYSHRYRPLSYDLKEGDLSVQVLLSEAQEILGNRVTCAEDLMTFSLTHSESHKD
ncbi:zinc phosphodiesterase ELAC protein 1-like isoform X2 [Babylonia areolata]